MSDPIALAREAERLLRAGDRDELGLVLSELKVAVRAQEQALAAASDRVARYAEVLERAVALTAAGGLEPMAAHVLDAMLSVVDAHRGFVGLVRGDGWEVIAARALSEGDLSDASTQVSRTVIDRALGSGAPVVTADAQGEIAAASVDRLALRSVACLPLVSAAGNPLGFVYLDHPGETGLFDEAALAAVQAWLPQVARCVAQALDAARTPFEGFVTRSPVVRAQLAELARIAPFDVPVLLTGETGTGKSLLARRLHDASPRATGPFVQVNCGAIPDTLIEAELFGAEAGAFTGARTTRRGRFEAAEGGTLFLDELDAMPPSCQVKLLVALQERTITRLGSNTPRRFDVRVVCAAGSEPGAAIAEGRLREDLYYRISVFELRMPPLRDRPEDLPLLARYFLDGSRERFGLPPLRLSERALSKLMAHDWPGNVRELANTLDRAALLASDGVIDDLRLSRATPRPHGTLAEAVADLARTWVRAADVDPRLRDLGLLRAPEGAVLLEAIRWHGSRDAAFRALGEGAMVEARNHHRVLHRAVERLAALHAALGLAPPEAVDKE